MASAEDDPDEHDEVEREVVVVEEVDESVEPEGEEAPPEAGAQQHALGAETVAQVAAQDL